MAYRNKTYVAFDGDTDIRYYRLMQAWKENDKIDFDFNNAHDINMARDSSSDEQIKRQLYERMKNSKNFILLVGERTKNNHSFLQWEIEHAIKLELPIIVSNLNEKCTYDWSRCPKCLNDLNISVSFGSKIIKYALDDWPESYENHKQKGETGNYQYKKSVYDGLGLKYVE